MLPHKHVWKKIKTKHGIWEQCDCGENRIDGILQEPIKKDNNIQPERISEVQIPDGQEFEVLRRAKTISQNNIKIINMIKQKTNINYTVIAKQIKTRTQDSKDQRLDTIRKQTAKRIEVFGKAIKKIKPIKNLIGGMDQIITAQLKTLRRFDDRASIIYFEKIMAHFAISMGYDRNDIARMLNITTKHIKINVLIEQATNLYLENLEWFGRYPNSDCDV